MRLVCISDTHGRERELEMPQGDCLVVAGDFTNYGTMDQLKRFCDWLGALSYKHMVVIAGNHEWCFMREAEAARAMLKKTGAVYLEDSSTSIGGLLFWGSPWTPAFCNWAFNDYETKDSAARWSKIPQNTDVLITHGPPYAILDMIGERHVGDQELLKRMDHLAPKAHIFGHIHSGAGFIKLRGTTFVNAAQVDEHYRAANKPIIIDVY